MRRMANGLGDLTPASKEDIDVVAGYCSRLHKFSRTLGVRSAKKPVTGEGGQATVQAIEEPQ